MRRDWADWRPPDGPAYVYLLGQYLGDGHIAGVGRSSFLRISMDSLYPLLVGRVQVAIELTFPGRRATVIDSMPGRGLVVQAGHPALVHAFPQHGPGKKHERPIRLVDWQLDLTHAYPEHLIRGLIHSDGSRCINRFQTKLPSGRLATYEYPRYFFTNYSADIRGIFCDHCDLLGIRWTQPNPRNISVSHHDSVAFLDSFVGPKR